VIAKSSLIGIRFDNFIFSEDENCLSSPGGLVC